MIGKLNHVAIVVPDLDAAAATYRDTLGASVSAPVALPEHGVTTVFVELPNTKIELLHPLGEDSPITRFLERNPGGGMHHLCYEVEDIHGACAELRAGGARLLGDEPTIGAHGKPVLLYDFRCAGSQAYMHLAGEVLRREEGIHREEGLPR